MTAVLSFGLRMASVDGETPQRHLFVPSEHGLDAQSVNLDLERRGVLVDGLLHALAVQSTASTFPACFAARSTGVASSFLPVRREERERGEKRERNPCETDDQP
jgi:hypothetical protein